MTSPRRQIATTDKAGPGGLAASDVDRTAIAGGETPDGMLRRLLATGGITAHLQPIVSVRDHRVLGLESLLRGWCPVQQRLIPPHMLFASEDPGLQCELEARARQAAVTEFSAAVREQGQSPLLFMNLDMSAESPEQAAEVLRELVTAYGLHPQQVALELLESEFSDDDAVARAAEELRAAEFVLVLDDMGKGHANLDRVCLIRPDIMKLDRSLVENIETDHYKQETFKCLAQLARRTGALVVAEGIETQSQGMAAIELGADLLQGYYFARPAPAAGLELAAVEQRVEALAVDFRQQMIGKISHRRRDSTAFGQMTHEICAALSAADPEHFDELLQRLCFGLAAIECVYVIDPDGRQVTDTQIHPASRQRNATLFSPSRRGTDHSFKDFFYLVRNTELSRFTTEPYVSRATGSICRTISTRLMHGKKMYVLCIDVVA
jgi:EAL domain-containing protein (putative c-di-GMP-specific phosphodiesterase class I)